MRVPLTCREHSVLLGFCAVSYGVCSQAFSKDSVSFQSQELLTHWDSAEPKSSESYCET